MARYSESERRKNQRTIRTATVFGLLVALTAGAVQDNALFAILRNTVFVLVIAAVFWWLFASRKSGNLDGGWLDGWNDRGELNDPNVVIFPFTKNLPPKPARKSDEQPQDRPPPGDA